MGIENDTLIAISMTSKAVWFPSRNSVAVWRLEKITMTIMRLLMNVSYPYFNYWWKMCIAYISCL